MWSGFDILFEKENWVDLYLQIKRDLGLSNDSLTDEMRAEIERLGLSVDYFANLAKRDGLKFAKSFLGGLKIGSCLFEKWYPRTLEFVKQCRLESPFPDPNQLGFKDHASLSLIQQLVKKDEHPPRASKFNAAFFSAPLHTLPAVMSLWPSSHLNPVFLTPQELERWQDIYRDEEPNREAWWFEFHHWNVDWSPPPDSTWLSGESFEAPDGLTPLLLTQGMYWGSLAGDASSELWGVDSQGTAHLLKQLQFITY